MLVAEPGSRLDAQVKSAVDVPCGKGQRSAQVVVFRLAVSSHPTCQGMRTAAS